MEPASGVEAAGEVASLDDFPYGIRCYDCDRSLIGQEVCRRPLGGFFALVCAACADLPAG